MAKMSTVTLPDTMVRYATGDDKTQMVESREVFDIERIEFDDSNAEYGNRWVLTCRSQATGDLFKLSLGASPNRDLVMAELDTTIHETGEPIEDVRLDRVPTKKGNPFYTLVPSDGE